MFRTAALFAVLAAASSPAVAQPYERDYPVDRDYPRQDDRWHDRYDAWEQRDRHPNRWQPLVDFASARDGSKFIHLPPYAQMSRLRIEGTNGHPVVTRVDIYYDDHVQPVTVNRRLLRGQSVELNVDQRREVRRVVIHTDPRYRGGYSVWGG